MSDGFGKYDVYAVASSIYCYGDTAVLKNRFGIRDAAQLKKIEADVTAVRQNDLLAHPINGHFTVNHLCSIHRYLFGDIYPFAGHFRREDIMKGSTRFLAFAEIPAKLKKLLEELRAEKHLQGLGKETLISRSAYYFAELNYIHPFREGNGRSTRELMRLLFLKNGFEVDWGAVPAERLLQAMELSVYDTSELQKVLHTCLSPIE